MTNTTIIDIRPIVSALRALICDESSGGLSDADARACANCLLKLFEFMQSSPESRGAILQQVGVDVCGLLGQRAIAQLFSATLIQQARGE